MARIRRSEDAALRLMKRNGYSETEALARIHAQLPIDEKRSLAQVVIDNNGSPEATRAQVKAAGRT